MYGLHFTHVGTMFQKYIRKIMLQQKVLGQEIKPSSLIPGALPFPYCWEACKPIA